MSDIPTELYRDILIILPAEFLIRFRRVCKAWRSIIDDPAFAHSHLHLHRNRQSNGGQLMIRNATGKLYSFSVDSLCYSGKRFSRSLTATNIKNLVGRGIPCLQSLPMPSCDGLILIYRTEISQEKRNTVWILWNPFNGDFINLPQRDAITSKTLNLSSVGLGYDLISNDYKVLSLVECFEYVGEVQKFWLETFVYSLKSGKWRRAEDFNNCCAPYISHGVYFNGALYWINSSKQTENSILTFDLGAETYKVTPLPLHLSSANLNYFSDTIHLNMMDESLFMIVKLRREPYSLWMLKIDGGQSKWEKVFVSSRFNNWAIAYCKRKKQLLINYDGHQFMWFDIEKKTKQQFRLCEFDMDYGFTSQVFQPNLLRLGNSVGEENVAGEATNRKRKRAASAKWVLELESTGWWDG